MQALSGCNQQLSIHPLKNKLVGRAENIHYAAKVALWL